MNVLRLTVVNTARGEIASSDEIALVGSRVVDEDADAGGAHDVSARKEAALLSPAPAIRAKCRFMFGDPQEAVVEAGEGVAVLVSAAATVPVVSVCGEEQKQK